MSTYRLDDEVYKSRPARLYRDTTGNYYIYKGIKRIYVKIPKSHRQNLRSAQEYLARKLKAKFKYKKVKPKKRTLAQENAESTGTKLKYESPSEKINQTLQKTLTLERLRDAKNKLIKSQESVRNRYEQIVRDIESYEAEEEPDEEAIAELKNELAAIPHAVDTIQNELLNVTADEYKIMGIDVSQLERDIVSKALSVPIEEAKKFSEQYARRQARKATTAKLNEVRKVIKSEQKIAKTEEKVKKDLEDFKKLVDLPPTASKKAKATAASRMRSKLNVLREAKKVPLESAIPLEEPPEPEIPLEEPPEIPKPEIFPKEIANSLRHDDRKLDDIVEEAKQIGSGSRDNPEKRTGSALWSDEITDYFKGNPRFAGVFAVDEMKFLPHKALPFGFVVNMSRSDQPGTHWCSVWITPDSIEYYDPTGHDPPKSLIKDLRAKLLEWHLPILLKLKINKVSGQNNSTNHCGYFAIRFLDERMSGKSFAEATRFTSAPTTKLGGTEKQIGENAIKSEFSLL